MNQNSIKETKCGTKSPEDFFLALALHIENHGYATAQNLFSESLPHLLSAETHYYFEHGYFKQAGIGKGVEKKKERDIRGDKIFWLRPQNLTPALRDYWTTVEELRSFLSTYFRIGLPWQECHLAVYPSGSFYRRHLDQFRETANRSFSFILYLNPHWQESHGGQLRLYLPQGAVDIAPTLGHFICFRSDLIEHEVLRTTVPRYSITGWMRRDAIPLPL